ncbi:hypothetical protein CVT24_010984 [Panaeolus cyanescens]|uniref:G domain-containing protein n=1 Tax=Panaeolus cyanescens TaxID=181874 RepID=A0A409YVT9_9AGAR|nr:hypothetical protein CVT24_010984 [Panaeolus cyanescens]
MEKIGPSDKVILVLGPTGAGKSQFIESAIHDPTLQLASSSLKSDTQDIRLYRLSKRPSSRFHDETVVLVDTPGFDDTDRDDKITLDIISRWLRKQYQSESILAGVLWLHPINKARMNKAAVDNFNLFVQLSGPEAAKSVVFVTTMWDLPSEGQSASSKLVELERDFWKEMIENGAKVAQFDKRDHVNAAWSIIATLASQQTTRNVLRLQRELSTSPDIKRTSAFRTLLDDVERLTQDYRSTNERLQSLKLRHKGNIQHPDVVEAQRELKECCSRLESAIEASKKQKIFKRRLFGLVKTTQEKQFYENLKVCPRLELDLAF